jgi:hypothetical protein
MAETTRLNRPWLIKMVAFATLLIFFGFYGLYDATIGYPNRGLRYAEFCKYQYLDTAKTEHKLDRRGVSVEEPALELSRLEKLEPGRREPLDGPRLDWLRALSTAHQLKPALTKIDDPDAEYARLKTMWTTSSGGHMSAPKPLSAFDIWVQWIYVALGFGGGFWMIIHFIAVARQKYRWEAETRTLTLPDGTTLTPTDIEEFDKRKWDKFLIYLKIKPAHATRGGQELLLDLYRYTPLEAWVLEMEKTAFPERAQETVVGDAPAPTPPTA